jgi:hypothetical protein
MNSQGGACHPQAVVRNLRGETGSAKFAECAFDPEEATCS